MFCEAYLIVSSPALSFLGQRWGEEQNDSDDDDIDDIDDDGCSVGATIARSVFALW